MFGSGYRKSTCQELVWVWNFTLIANYKVSLPQFHGCWQNTWDSWSETKDFITHRSHSQSGGIFLGWFPDLQSPQWQEEGVFAHSGWHYRRRILSLRSPHLLWRTVSISFASGISTVCVFCGSQQTYILLCVLLYQHPRKHSLEQKPSVPLLKRHAEMWESHGP